MKIKSEEVQSRPGRIKSTKLASREYYEGAAESDDVWGYRANPQMIMRGLGER